MSSDNLHDETTKEDIDENAVKSEALAWAKFFGRENDPEAIAARERLNRSNLSLGYFEYLKPFVGELS